MRPTTDFAALPKFLVADDGQDRFFVVHCHPPRFIIEIDDTDEGVPLWIDEPAGLDTAACAKLVGEAGDFFDGQIERH